MATIRLFSTAAARWSRTIARPIVLGVLSAAPIAAPGEASAQDAATRVVMDLRCGKQTERFGDDEPYITATVVRSQGPTTSRFVWGGDMNDDGDKKIAGNLLVWDGTIRDGEVITFLIHTFEQDGSDYEPALRLAAKAAQAFVALQAGGTGAAAQGAAQYIAGMNAGSIISGICSNDNCTDTDDWVGTFGAYIRNDRGTLQKYIYPIYRGRWVNTDTVLQLDGGGGLYYPGIRVNGENFEHLR
jgi:hypothetical protein